MTNEAVEISDITAPSRPRSEIDRLADYLANGFIPRKQALVQLNARASQLKLKGELNELGFAALAFIGEVDDWLPVAERLLDQELANELDDARSEYSADGGKALAEQVRQRARQNTAPLKEAVATLRNAQKWGQSIVSFCQSTQRTISTEEFGELFASTNEVPEKLFEAPVGDSLNRISGS